MSHIAVHAGLAKPLVLVWEMPGANVGLIVGIIFGFLALVCGFLAARIVFIGHSKYKPFIMQHQQGTNAVTVLPEHEILSVYEMGSERSIKGFAMNS